MNPISGDTSWSDKEITKLRDDLADAKATLASKDAEIAELREQIEDWETAWRHIGSCLQYQSSIGVDKCDWNRIDSERRAKAGRRG